MKLRLMSRRKIPTTAIALSRRMRPAVTMRRTKEPRQIYPVLVAGGAAPIELRCMRKLVVLELGRAAAGTIAGRGHAGGGRRHQAPR
jgi:tRNA isopentenyl-2-thiomethyl-A-37 hydroxylase MiaE